MRFAVSTIVLLVCIGVVCCEYGYHYQHRKRLGRLSKGPFIELYKTYKAAFNKDDKLPHDDSKFFVPAASECVNFLSEFRQNKYELFGGIETFVVLDACLGYLYESEHHEEDKQANEYVKDNLDSLIDDEKLSSIYGNTNIHKLDEKNQVCIANLLANSILMRKQFSQDQCNDNWLQLFLQFAECQESGEPMPKDMRNVEVDSYVGRLYDLVKRDVNFCVDHELHILNEAVTSLENKNVVDRVAKPVRKLLNPQRKQQAQRKWPWSILKLFSAVQDTKGEVSIREVHRIIKGYFEGDQAMKERFLEGLAHYADAEVKPSKSTLKDNPNGSELYNSLVNGLCQPFRSTDREKGKDFSRSYIRLVRLIQHEDVFGISEEQFTRSIFENSFGSGPMYISIAACNLITFTRGQAIRSKENGKYHYEVNFVSDTSNMVRWPVSKHY